MEKMNSLLHRKISALLWHPDRSRDSNDVRLEKKVQSLGWIQPRHIELPKHEKTTNYPMWQVTADLFKQMSQARTPTAAMRHLCEATATLNSAYALAFPDEQ